MRINGDLVYRLVVILSLTFYTLYFILRSQLQLEFEQPTEAETEKFTIRVNTFRRNDLLTAFLAHYTTCSKVGQPRSIESYFTEYVCSNFVSLMPSFHPFVTIPQVELIQVVWSDQKNSPPSDLTHRYPSNKVMYERHSTDRLSNRFKPLQPLTTRGVLSIDDDLLISCQQLHQGFNIWTVNEKALVGYSPRMHGVNSVTGEDRYLRWQNTWWSGVYSISLTKASFLHKQYLQDFFTVLPASFIADIDAHRNCEDLAMAYVAAVVSHAPPVWVQAVVHETADFGISTGASHFDDRSFCLTKLRQVSLNASSNEGSGGGRNIHMSQRESLPLVSSYQKAIPLSPTWDWIRLSQGGGK